MTARAIPILLVLISIQSCRRDEPPAGRVLEHQIRARALLDDEKYREAEQEFERAITIEPDNPINRFGLAACALRGSRDARKSVEWFERLLQDEPNSAAGHFGAAMAYRLLDAANFEENYEQARRHLARARELAESNPDVHYFLGDTLKNLDRTDEAIASFNRAADLDPTDPAPINALAGLWRRRDPERAREYRERFDVLFKADPDRKKQEWSDLLDRRLLRVDADPTRVAPSSIAVVFRDRTPDAGLPDANVAGLDVADVDADGNADLLLAGGGFFRGDGSFRFDDAGAALGLDPLGDPFTGVTAQDLDNDGRHDVFLTRPAGNLLLVSAPTGGWTDKTNEAGVASPGAYAALAFDYDHEGDLDLLLVGASGASSLRLLSNGLPPLPHERDGTDAGPRALTYHDVTQDAGVATTGDALVVDVADVENGNDTDFVVLGETSPGRLFSNLRGGRFAERGREAGLADVRASELLLFDADADSFLDLVTRTRAGDVRLQRNRGDGSFDAPAALPGVTGARAIASTDADNDGFLDLVVGAAGRFELLGNHAGRFAVREAAFGPAAGFARRIVPGDVDGDGDEDLCVLEESGRVRVLDNDGGSRHHRVLLRLVGHKSNRTGVGSKVELRVGDLYVKREVRGSTVALGIGAADQLGLLSILWTNGVRQPYYDVDLTDPRWTTEWQRRDEEAAPSTVDAPFAFRIEQIDRVGGSCPLLYAWNGERYAFVTDVLCQSPLGLDLGGGVRAIPNPDDWVTIQPDQLRPIDGELRLRFTEELREISYVDRVRLVAVDHPDDVFLTTDNAFAVPPFPEFALHPARERRRPVSATDDRGVDVLDRLLVADRSTVDTFRACAPPMQGVAEMHHLDLDLGDLSDTSRIRLFLFGWFLWTNSSINRALAEDGTWAFTPPLLEVGDGEGGFRPAGVVGLPAGGEKMVVCDLTGRIAANDPRVRIRTNLQVYWDWAFVSTDPEPAALPTRLTTLEPTSAELRHRGYSRRIQRGHGAPLGFDYHDVTEAFATYWGRHTGAFTRFGDVLPLLDEADDMYVVMDHGEEIALAFDARALPTLEAGWTRTFVLRSIGWAKDADANSSFSTSVEPLPFLGMSGYPYPSSERYPDDAEHREYLQTWNTRRRVDRSPTIDPAR